MTKTKRKSYSIYLTEKERSFIQDAADKSAMPFSRFVIQMVIEAIRKDIHKKFVILEG